VVNLLHKIKSFLALYLIEKIIYTQILKDWLSDKNYAELAKIPVDVILDIGVAEKGTPHLYKNFSKKIFHLIDPIPNLQPRNLPNTYELHSIALGAPGEAVKKFNLSGEGTSSHTRTSGQTRWRTLKTFDSQTITLDQFFSNIFVENKYYGIKIDAEGDELNILSGLSEKYSSNVNFIVVECIVTPSYVNNYFASEIFDWMNKNNFELVGFLNLPLNRTFFDLVFVAKKFVKSHLDTKFFDSTSLKSS
jgi:FkbM family methyltransferase